MRIRIVIDANAEDSADLEDVAAMVFNYLCASDDDETPGVMSFDFCTAVKS